MYVFLRIGLLIYFNGESPGAGLSWQNGSMYKQIVVSVFFVQPIF